MDPRQNTTFLMENNLLYTATVADFSGIDSLIYRHDITSIDNQGLRTQKNNDMLLNKPEFVGILHSAKVNFYFIFNDFFISQKKLHYKKYIKFFFFKL